MKKIMQKCFAGLVLLLIIMMLVSGCGGEKTCSKPGCDKPVYNEKTGLCFDHTMDLVDQIDKYYDDKIDYYQGLLDKAEAEGK